MKNITIIKSFYLVLSLLFILSVNASASDTANVKSVLIAKSNSWIENKVSALLTDSLVKIGYKVTTLDVKAISGENAGDYFITVVFDGIKSAKFIEPLYKYSNDVKVKKVNFFLFRITGDIHDLNTNIDAFTAATKTIKPQSVADKIISTIMKVSAKSDSTSK
ncbi:MAG: hypothetical protein JNL74_17620 [Fibrobacteres bacterium]|nr:hypothetical protein [Fibrobacterota bacterium]